jgi:hypothetical protein
MAIGTGEDSWSGIEGCPVASSRDTLGDRLRHAGAASGGPVDGEIQKKKAGPFDASPA